jgi:uncharacterized OB-fold protein
MTTATSRPRPVIDETNARYWESARAHALELPRCNDCSQVFYPPRAICPRCLSVSIGWAAVSGDATLFTWNVMHQVYSDAFRELVPYVVAVVQLEEGPRIITNMLRHDLGQLHVGMKLQLDYLDIDEELTLPVFIPSSSK